MVITKTTENEKVIFNVSGRLDTATAPELEAELNKVFDDILMQKVLPRIEGDYDKTYKPLAALKTKAETKGWTKSKEKIDFMLDRFSKDDQGGFTSFWN